MRTCGVLLVLAGALVLHGCAATGSAFHLRTPVPNTALVYVYRPPASFAGARSPTLVDNDQRIGDIRNGQFIDFDLQPGHHLTRTDTEMVDRPLEMDVEVGYVYYLRAGIRAGMWTSTWFLSRVYPEEAQPEIASCCKRGD